MAGVRVFTDLLIWQKARAWSKAIFWETKKSPFYNDQRLVVQINDSSESVFANMAEGFGRGTQGEFVTFLGYSLGSLNETQSHLCRRMIASTCRRTHLGSFFNKEPKSAR